MAPKFHVHVFEEESRVSKQTWLANVSGGNSYGQNRRFLQVLLAYFSLRQAFH